MTQTKYTMPNSLAALSVEEFEAGGYRDCAHVGLQARDWTNSLIRVSFP